MSYPTREDITGGRDHICGPLCLVGLEEPLKPGLDWLLLLVLILDLGVWIGLLA